jgi:hypothetical protein
LVRDTLAPSTFEWTISALTIKAACRRQYVSMTNEIDRPIRDGWTRSEGDVLAVRPLGRAQPGSRRDFATASIKTSDRVIDEGVGAWFRDADGRRLTATTRTDDAPRRRATSTSLATATIATAAVVCHGRTSPWPTPSSLERPDTDTAGEERLVAPET